MLSDLTTPATDASYILGIRILRDRSNHRISLDQIEYAKRVMKRFLRENEQNLAARTPLPTRSIFPNDGDQCPPEQRRKYQETIGSLMYLMMGTRPDLAYAVGKLGSFASNPSGDPKGRKRRQLRPPNRSILPSTMLRPTLFGFATFWNRSGYHSAQPSGSIATTTQPE